MPYICSRRPHLFPKPKNSCSSIAIRFRRQILFSELIQSIRQCACADCVLEIRPEKKGTMVFAIFGSVSVAIKTETATGQCAPFQPKESTNIIYLVGSLKEVCTLRNIIECSTLPVLREL